MLLTSFDPFVAEFDRMVQRTFGWRDAGTGRGFVTGRTPLAMDVTRRDDSVVLRLDLPGAESESIEVTTDHNVLTVSAKRSEEYAEGERPVLRERVSGSFYRRIKLAETIDTDRIEAEYDNGVLNIVLPLAEQAKPRKIEIKGAGHKELTA
jgi:HSP20 family protein